VLHRSTGTISIEEAARVASSGTEEEGETKNMTGPRR
jgi:hypothetical protein